jgi:hypothetical protein
VIEPVTLSSTGFAPVETLRPGSTYGFVFTMTPADVANVGAGFGLSSRPMVLFTDDADSMWRIDDDLRLRQVTSRILSRERRRWLTRLPPALYRRLPRWLRYRRVANREP